MRLAKQTIAGALRMRNTHPNSTRDRSQELTLGLREQAIDALRSSTTMLNVAVQLLKQGNSREADRLRQEARAKRNESKLLMARLEGLNRTGSFAH